MGGVSADGKVLWLSGRYSHEVYAIDTSTGHLLARIPVGAGPHGLCVWPQPGRYSLGHTGDPPIAVREAARPFRPDIEGLRAIAVVLVVAFHAGVPGITGGYIGVDVFFVISGFLITGLLVASSRAPGRSRSARSTPAASGACSRWRPSC